MTVGCGGQETLKRRGRLQYLNRALFVMNEEVSGEVKDAVFIWISTFEHVPVKPEKGFCELGNGIVIEQILHQVSPDHFANSSLDREAIASDAVLASAHVSSILGSMLTYFEEVFKKTVDIGDISPTNIARGNEASILKWVQLLVGAVVMCEKKELFIKRIFNLPRSAQNVLKTLVENFMHSLKDYLPGNSPRGSSEALMIKHMRNERDQLIKEVNELKHRNLELHTKIEMASGTIKDGSAQQVNVHGEGDEGSAKLGFEGGQGDTNVTTALKLKVEELERAVDEKGIEHNILTEEMSTKIAELARCQQEKEQLVRQGEAMSEEIDASKETALKLAKAESTVLKYQQKLDGFVALKREHKGQQEQLEMYQEMEGHLESAQEQMQVLKEELGAAKKESKALQGEKSAFASLLMDKQNELDEMQERCERLEEEVKALKASSPASAKEASPASLEEEKAEEEDDEIEDVEIEPPPRHLTHADEAELAALRSKLAQTEAELLDSHASNDRLRTEKERLETYSRESIQAFQRKFTATLQTVQEEKEMLEGALERLADRCEFDRETFRKEERLLLSALHSLGVEMMGMNVKRHLGGIPTQSTAQAGFVGSPTTNRTILGGSQQRQVEALDSLLT